MPLETHSLYGGTVTLVSNFDSKNHSYTVDGKIVDGVTTILGVLDKPFLTPWASKMAVMDLGYYERQIWTPKGYVEAPEVEQAEGLARMNAILEHFKIMTADEFWAALHNAKNAHMRKKQEAASIGTLVHTWIEGYIKGVKQELPTIPKVRNGVDAFIKWVEQNNVVFQLSEKKVYSRKYKVAGTLDWTAIVNGISTLGDIKTSNFFNPEMFWQTSAYQHARQEEFPEEKYDQQIIVRCGKDGELEVFISKEYKKDIKAFAACATIYRRKKTTKKHVPIIQSAIGAGKD